MPTVPDYGDQKVGQTPLPGARQTGPGGIAETPGSLGAGVDQAVANLGLVGVRAGLQAREISEEHRQKELRRRNELFELSATRQATEAAERILRDPNTGVLNARGIDVMKAREAGLEQWKTTVGTLRTSAANPDQELIAQHIADAYTARIHDSIDTHQSQQLREYDDNEFKGLQAAASSLIVASAITSPGTVTDTILDVSDKVTKYAQRNGLGPEATKAMVADARNNMAAAAITESLTKGNPVLAKSYIEHYTQEGIITGEARVKLEEAVKRGMTDDAAETLSSELWAQHGPRTDTEAISIDKLEDLARARTKGDPDLLKATIAALRTRKQAVDDGRRERLNTTQTRLWGMVLQGAPYSAIAATPEGATHPEELLKVRDYIDSRAAQAESRAYSAESRAYTRETRIAGELSRHEQELEDAGWAKYYELAQPDNLQHMNEGNIMALLPTLGHTLTNRLLANKAELTKSTAALSKATIDTDLFKENTYRAGFTYAYATPGQMTDAQRVALGKLRAAVEDEVAAEQISKGHALTREETTAVQQRVIDRKVMVDRSLRVDVSVPAAMVTDAEKQRAYVPIVQIPYSQVSALLGHIRGLHPAWAQFDDARLRALPGVDRAIERSYAAMQLKLGREAVNAPFDELR